MSKLDDAAERLSQTANAPSAEIIADAVRAVLAELDDGSPAAQKILENFRIAFDT